MMNGTVNIQNKRATFEYHILDKYITGIQLMGTEVKSVRQGKVNLGDAYCTFIEGEVYILNLHIAEYSHGSFYNHEIKRSRKLLLTKQEMRKISNKLKDAGTTLIPLRMFFSDRGFAKLEIGLAKGKQDHDKRESIKERDAKKEIGRHHR